MRFTMVVLAGMLAVSANAASKHKATLVDGRMVVPQRAFTALPIGYVTNLRFISCAFEGSGAPCTVIAGTFTSDIPSPDHVVMIEIDMFDADILPKGGRLLGTETVRAAIDPLPRGKSVPFKILAPPWFREDKELTQVPMYSVHIRAIPHHLYHPPGAPPVRP